MYTREQTRVVNIGNTAIGGGNPIRIQSMTNTKTADVASTVSQILRLEEAGCEIVRSTVPDEASAKAIAQIKKQIHIPIVADIHFDYRCAIWAMENGADKIRINPGNLGGKEKLKLVVDKAKEYHVPIRVGVNSGSLEQDLFAKYGRTAKALSESALRNVGYLEEFGFEDIVVSIKASDVNLCAQSYELFAKERNYPLHLGITEAGGVMDGSIKSALGLGIMLREGLGDTIRVSLTGNREEDPELYGDPPKRRGDRFLPDLRTNRDRPDQSAAEGGEGACPYQDPDEGRDHGLHREWSGRSARVRFRHCGRKGCRAAFQKRRSHPESPGGRASCGVGGRGGEV